VIVSRVRTAAAGLILLLAACAGSSGTAPPHPTPTAVASFRVGAPVGLAVAAGQVWAASSDTGTIVGRDVATGRLTHTVQVGPTPLRVLAAGGLVWVSVFGAGRVRAVDPESGRVVRDVAVPGQPEGLAAGFGSIWVVRQAARLLTRISPAGRVMQSQPLGSEPRLVTTSTRSVLVSDFRDGTLNRIDPASGRRVVSARLCDGPQGLAAAGTTVWVACTTDGRLLAVDEGTLHITARLPLSGEPDAVRVVSGRLFVAATEGPTVYEMSADPAAPRILRRQPLGRAYALRDQANVDLAVAGGRVWVSSFSEGRVAVAPG
jgi:DNA-binding beta-propeller fold protein YncE